MADSSPTNNHLLSDEQMAQFIAHGFVQLQTDFPEAFYRNIIRKMDEVYAVEGNPGNNLVPRVPEVQQIFDHPTVHGALTSILGPGYIMHAHRHGHDRKPDARRSREELPEVNPRAGWHKDNYWGNEKTRNHLPWSAMIFYYPQAVSEQMGPTQIIAGSQNRYNMQDDDIDARLSVVGPAGTFVVIDYDMWHRATPNFTDTTRHMLKFLFFRMEAPQRPEWNNARAEWREPLNMLPIKRNPLLWEHVWHWLSGSAAAAADGGGASEAGAALADGAPDVTRLAKVLRGNDENGALNAAYELARSGEAGIAALIAGLSHQSPDVVEPKSFSVPRLCAHGLAAAGAAAVPALITALDGAYENGDVRGQAAFALGEIGPASAAAVPKLIAMLDDRSAFIRQHAVEALGLIGTPTEAIVPVLGKALLDDDEYTRFLAGLALSRLGVSASAAVPALKQALYDAKNSASGTDLASPKSDNGARYAPFIATVALSRIRTNEALDVLLPYLQASRWCPATTTRSTF
ncbi:MAG: phytanoyl-CoA dioxygenase [Paenibacillaceae bacterium]|jgi:hypothetical protein|nr:phytanoyl-CoA dioxygenase [Paenibacillaceae bacterium]